MPRNSIHITLAQLPILDRRPSENQAHLKKLLNKISDTPTDLIVLPEIFLGGLQKNASPEQYIELYKDSVNILKEFSQKKKVHFYGSMMEKGENGKVYNTAFWIAPNTHQVPTYRKVHLFRYAGEDKTYHAGTKEVCLKTPWGPVVPAICYDLRFPELFRRQTKHSPRMIWICAQWPESRRDHWLSLLKARAIENQIFVIACNRKGQKGDLPFAGDSMIIDPQGQILLHMHRNRTVGHCQLDLRIVEATRKKFPFLADQKLI